MTYKIDDKIYVMKQQLSLEEKLEIVEILNDLNPKIDIPILMKKFFLIFAIVLYKRDNPLSEKDIDRFANWLSYKMTKDNIANVTRDFLSLLSSPVESIPKLNLISLN